MAATDDPIEDSPIEHDAKTIEDDPIETDESHGDDAGHSKSGWRRFLEVAVPVAVFAVATPFVVNGLANAVRDDDSAATSTPSAGAADTSATTTPSGETTPTTIAAPGTTITVPGLDQSADDRTKQLGAQIVAEVTRPPATTSGTDPATPATTVTTATTAPGTHSHGGVTPEVELTRAER